MTMNRPKGRKLKARSVAPLPLGGDHGTGTRAAMANKVLNPLTDEHGRNPNNKGRLCETDQLANMDFLSMRQYQAGMEIRNAWCGVEKLSSGSPLAEQVDSTPKPDATMAIQIDAQSRLVNVMRAVPPAQRDVIEHVCYHNKPITQIIGKGRQHYDRRAEFQVALDLVADQMRY